MAESSPSFKLVTNRVGTKDVRIRWGIGKPQKKSPLNLTTERLSETSEEKARRLLGHVSRAEFDSFQEYGFIAAHSEKGFTNTPSKDEYVPRKDDIITPSPVDLKRFENRSVLILVTTARLIDPDSLEKFGTVKTTNVLYCAVGEKDGKTIIQGGGRLHRDFLNRQGNVSAFKLVFDDKGVADEYIDWLKKEPSNALNGVLKKAIGEYDEQGKFVQTLLPSPRADDGRQCNDPIPNPANDKVETIIRDVRNLK